MSYAFYSSLLKSRWLIDPEYAQAHVPLLRSFLKGEISAEPFNGAFNPASKTYTLAADGTGTARNEKAAKGQNILVMPISGVITKFDGPCGEPGSLTRAKWLQAAKADDEIGAVILLLDTPGGEASGTQTLAAAIRDLGKPSYALVQDGMAASAGYWIASACTEIYCNMPTDKVGSVGVLTTLGDPTGAYEQEGWKIKTIYAPQSDQKNLAYRKVFGDTEEEQQEGVSMIEADLSRLASAFIAAVKTNRGNRLTNKQDAGDTRWDHGAMFYAPEAIKMGLADGIKTLDQLIEHASKNLSLKNRNTMSKSTAKQYSQIGAVLSWEEGHESTEEGVFLNHDEAATLDQHLTDKATELSTAKNDMATATTNATNLQTQLDTANAEVTRLKTELQNEKDTSAALKIKADAYDNSPANKGTELKPGAETTDDANAASVHPYTAEAMRVFGKKK